MGVTVSNLLKLPSLVNAKVVAGKGGLEKIVSSVSVLETMEYDLIDDHAYPNDEFNGSEIVITGFLNGADDVEAQYNSVKRLALSGEAGLIIYYVGVIVKKIDPSIIQLADELDFPIICMPENEFNLRYGEAISDIMGLIVRDQVSGDSMIITLLESISRLSPHQQNVGTMIRLISSRLSASVVLMTDKRRTLYESAWPSELTGIHKSIEMLSLEVLESSPVPFTEIEDALLYKEDINVFGTGYQLYLVHVGEPITSMMLQQAVEGVQIALKLWGGTEGESVAAEIVEAILTDQPLKMRSLSAMFHLDINAVDSMWVINGKDLTSENAGTVIEEARKFCGTVCADLYRESIVLFTDTIRKRADIDALKTNIETVLNKSVQISFFTNLKTTSEVRTAYLLNEESWHDAVKMMPEKNFYVRGDIEFAKECRHIIENGDESVSEYLSVFDAIAERTASADFIETLCVFLLDAQSNVQSTSDKMFVHKNTIKYRIKTISDCLGFSVGTMPESEKLYKACGIRRLME